MAGKQGGHLPVVPFAMSRQARDAILGVAVTVAIIALLAGVVVGGVTWANHRWTTHACITVQGVGVTAFDSPTPPLGETIQPFPAVFARDGNEYALLALNSDSETGIQNTTDPSHVTAYIALMGRQWCGTVTHQTGWDHPALP